MNIPINKINFNTLKKTYNTLYNKDEIDFKYLREYTTNDNIKKIAWKQSAKENKLLVKEKNNEKKYNILIVLDSNIKFNANTNKGEKKKDILLNIVKIISHITIKNNDYLEIIYSENNKTIYQKNIFKKTSIEKVLSDYNIKSSNNIYNINKLLSFIKQNIKNRKIIFIISDISGINNIKHQDIKSLTKKHDIFVINIEDNYFYGDNLYDVESNKYIPSFFSKDKKLKQIDIEVKNNLKNINRKKLFKYGINQTTISESKDIIYKLYCLLEEYKKWKKNY